MTTEIELSTNCFKHIKKQDRFILIEALRKLYYYSELKIAYAFGYTTRNALAVWISRNSKKYTFPAGFNGRSKLELKEIALEIIIKNKTDNIANIGSLSTVKKNSRFIPGAKQIIRIPTYSKFINYLRDNPKRPYAAQMLKNCEESERKHWRSIVMAVLDIVRDMV